jgi:tetratricopeptide (TPR) repeat protein
MGKKTCSYCGGSGTVQRQCTACGGGHVSTDYYACYVCHGSGKMDERCSICGGSGQVDDGASESSSSSSSSSSSYTPSSSGGRSSGPGPGDRFLSKQKEAFVSYRNNDIDTALKLCNDALEIFKPYLATTNKNDYYVPFIAQTFNLRGACHKAKGNIQQAKDDFAEAAYKWKNDEAYRNLENLQKTIEEERTKELADKASATANQLLDEGNYDKAIIQYTRTIRAGGSDKAVALMNRAACYAKKGDKEQAIDDYTDAINSGLTGNDLATAKAELAKLK